MLLAPLSLLLLFGFALPIGRLLYLSVDNSDVVRTLPRTLDAISAWDGEGVPHPNVYQALMDDLAVAPDALVSKVANRFNFERAGFRSVFLAAARAAHITPQNIPKEMLISAHKAWGDPAYWHVIRRAQGITTDFNLLAAIDLRYDNNDQLVAFSRTGGLHRQVLLRTLEVSAGVTLLCLGIGYPFAYLMASAPRPIAGLLVVVIVFPFWTSLLVRTTAWVTLLQNEGIINNIALQLGLLSERAQLIHNRFGVYVVMVHVLLPYMVLPIYSVMQSIPGQYVMAARSLGAGAVVTFRRVYLPLTMPGIIAGSTLVFILALGYYITPALVGGPGDQMVSYFIAHYTLNSLNWGMAAALSLILLAIVIVGAALVGLSLRLAKTGIKA